MVKKKAVASDGEPAPNEAGPSPPPDCEPTGFLHPKLNGHWVFDCSPPSRRSVAVHLQSFQSRSLIWSDIGPGDGCMLEIKPCRGK